MTEPGDPVMRSLSSALAILALVLGGYSLSWQVSSPQAEEVEEAPTPSVSEAELEIYIGVYKAMQADHGLPIEEAVRPYQMDLEAFRALERRVQANSRLVERVREALAEVARANSSLALSVLTPTPPPTPTAGTARKKKR